MLGVATKSSETGFANKPSGDNRPPIMVQKNYSCTWMCILCIEGNRPRDSAKLQPVATGTHQRASNMSGTTSYRGRFGVAGWTVIRSTPIAIHVGSEHQHNRMLLALLSHV